MKESVTGELEATESKLNATMATWSLAFVPGVNMTTVASIETPITTVFIAVQSLIKFSHKILLVTPSS